MQLHDLPPAARGYVRVVIALGTAGLLTVLLTARVPWSPALAAAIAAAAGLASQKLILVGMPGESGSRTNRMSTLSLGFPVVLGSMLWFGAAGGMIVGVASALGASLYPRRHPLYRLWFTCVNLGAAAYGSGCLMQKLGAPLGTAHPVLPLALLAGTLAYFGINTGMVSAAVALSQSAALWRTWRDGYLWTAPSYLAGAAVVASAGLLQSRCGGAVASLSFLCLTLVYHSYRCYLDRVHQLQVSEARLEEVCLAAVESLAQAIDAKDSLAHSHIRRVQQIGMALAERVGASADELQAIRDASLTHDVGKLAVPDTILSKAGRLSDEEFERMKTHVAIGVRILEPVRFPWPVVEVVKTHHERWDGRGYPAGLKSEAIPLGGRIVAIADAFDALTAPRPYRKALGFDEAHAIIRAGSGTQFDPRLVETFSAIFPDLVAVFADATEPGTSREGAGASEPAAHKEVWAQIRVASQEAQSVAFTDLLTGLANARHLANALPHELEAAQREGRSLSVLMIDLDGFKEINDGHGHLTGDAALQRVARLLEEAVRKGSTVCRYAGDEFVVLLPATAGEQARDVMDRLCAQVERCCVPGTQIPIRLSIGSATFPQDGREPQELLHAADRSMYADKSRRKAQLLAPIG